ncbi:MAG: hypothetical protein KKC18_00475 [Chloroflexi bacterium]|nr:hypothetical protein [Chloroflexota bacterium]
MPPGLDVVVYDGLNNSIVAARQRRLQPLTGQPGGAGHQAGMSYVGGGDGQAQARQYLRSASRSAQMDPQP